MTPHNHPTTTLLTEYAQGRLAFAPSLAVSAHIETCSVCQIVLARLEAEAGLQLEAQPIALMSAGALECALDRLDEEVAAPMLHPSHVGGVALPKAVRQAGLGGRRWMGSDVWAAPVRTSARDDWRAFLIKAPAGAIIPRHGHQGGEVIAVLSGGFHDGRAFGAGDFAENSADRHHRLTIDAGESCVCLIAIEGATQWRGWARVITPMLGI